MALRPSIEMSAPMRTISLACMKRFSKIVSVIADAPSACVARAMNCACMSVAKPGYSSVVTSAATSLLAPRTRKHLWTANIDLHAGFAQLGQNRREMLRRAAGHFDFASGNGAGDDERAGLDAVGNDRVRRPVQPFHALYTQCRMFPRLECAHPS